MDDKTLHNMNLDEQTFLKNLTNEINKIEKTIKYQKVIKRRNDIIKTFKINLKYAKVLTPYIITAFITLKTFDYLGFGLPFHKDIVKKNAYKITNIDYLGNKEETIEYKFIIEKIFSDCEIYLYSNWKKNENDEYERTVKKISLSEYNDDKVNDFLSDEFDIEEYNFKKQVEVKPYVSEDELIKDDNIKIKICIKGDDKDIIFEEENQITNIYCTIIILIFLQWAESMVRMLSPKSKLKEEIEKIKDEYPDLNVDNLKMKLKIKKANLNRLTR